MTDYPSDAAIRDAARAIAPELTGQLGAEGAAIPAAVTVRLPAVRQIVGASATRTPQIRLAGMGYVLAHILSSDLAGSQGSTSAPIGSAMTGGAVVATSVGGMSISTGAGVVGQAAAHSIGDAYLGTSAYGRAWLALRGTLPGPVMPRCA